jgi:hypothetical protein
MRQRSVGILMMLLVACLPLHPSPADDKQPGSQMTGAGMGPESGGVLEFQVVSRETKEPIAGVNLEIRVGSDSKGDVTDAQGRCRIAYGPQPPSYLSIRASKEGRGVPNAKEGVGGPLVPMQVAWRRPPIPQRYTLALEPGTSIGGIIQDESGKPIAGVTVYLLVPGGTGTEVERVSIWEHPVTTDAAGRWRCDIMPAKLDDIWMRLEHADYVSDEMYGATPKPPMERLRDMTGVMVMKKGCTVAGRVLDVEGKPIQWATAAQGADRFGSDYPSARTDGEGRFEFRHARPGQMVLTVQAGGYAPDLRQILVREGAEPVEFRLERGRTLRGRIVDKAGNPVAGAFVAADTWRGYRSLQWRVNTDDRGRFQWDDAPRDDVLMDMGKQGYMSLRHYSLTASDQEQMITMHAVLRIAGRVVDKETGQPISRFTLVPGYDSGDGRPVYWDRRNARLLTDGRYETGFSEPRPGHLVRIEAEGYLPEVSRVFDDSEGHTTFDFALRQGAALSGTVCLPDGRPVAGAQVILGTRAQGIFLRNGRSDRAGGNLSVETGQDGRFSLPAQTDPYVLVVLHDQGYAQVTDDDLKASPTVILRPWGRVEGQVLIGLRPGANQDVRLLFDRPSQPGTPRVYHEGGAVTDKDGHFVCERVAPGRATIGREIMISEHSRRFAQLIAIEIKAGETTRLTIGGRGRPVTGRVVFPDEVKDKINRQTMECFMRGQAGEDSSRVWGFKLEPEGTFRAEDIPAGEHCLYVYAYALATVPRASRGEQIGTLTHPFTVPEMPEGRSDEPLDLGTLELLIHGGTVSASPLLGNPVRDLKDLSLGITPEETSGKRLLVCFFDMNQRPSRNAVLQLAKQAGQLKEKQIVVALVQVVKVEEAAFKEWVRENAIPFPVGRTQSDEQKVRSAWGVRSLPWLILTNRDHTVTAQGFAFEELAATVSGGK